MFDVDVRMLIADIVINKTGACAVVAAIVFEWVSSFLDASLKNAGRNRPTAPVPNIL